MLTAVGCSSKRPKLQICLLDAECGLGHGDEFGKSNSDSDWLRQSLYGSLFVDRYGSDAILDGDVCSERLTELLEALKNLGGHGRLG